MFRAGILEKRGKSRAPFFVKIRRLQFAMPGCSSTSFTLIGLLAYSSAVMTRYLLLACAFLPFAAVAADAPAFTSKELSASPTTNWITNGGTLFNQRYSPLNQINTTNVRDLKAEWRTHLNGS